MGRKEGKGFAHNSEMLDFLEIKDHLLLSGQVHPAPEARRTRGLVKQPRLI